MVGFNPYSRVELSALECSLAGVASGIITRVLVQPLDVLKIRFQLQMDPIKRKHGKYHSMTQASKLIIKEEGLISLWKGHIPAQGLSIVYGAVQFGAFEVLTSYVWKYLPHKLTTEYYPFTNFVCGGSAGVLAMTAALPLDVLRTRFVAQGEPKMYRSISHACVKMLREEGFMSFYRGFIPTVVQMAPYAGVQFCLYSVLVRLWNRLLLHVGPKYDSETGALESLVCGSLAGAGGKMAVYPLDLLKKRLQTIGFEQARYPFGTVHSYRGLIHCIASIVKHEGIPGMFKGLTPSLVKAGLASGIGFLSYEQTCVALKWLHHSRSQS